MKGNAHKIVNPEAEYILVIERGCYYAILSEPSGKYYFALALGDGIYRKL